MSIKAWPEWAQFVWERPSGVKNCVGDMVTPVLMMHVRGIWRKVIPIAHAIVFQGTPFKIADGYEVGYLVEALAAMINELSEREDLGTSEDAWDDFSDDLTDYLMVQLRLQQMGVLPWKVEFKNQASGGEPATGTTSS